MKTIAITTGDSDGIGPEVTQKALLEVPLAKDIHCLVYFDQAFQEQFEANLHPENTNKVEWLPREDSPARWVLDATQKAQLGDIQGLCTAPLSKTCIAESGLDYLGHTDILKKTLGIDELFMAFLGKQFSVVLVTDHLPLEEVGKNLTEARLKSGILKTKDFFERHQPGSTVKVMGLNPHAGEEGLLGDFERRRLNPLLYSMGMSSALPADSSFGKAQKNDVFLCMYHDQGLGPFKAAHGLSGSVHLTLGLPFVRTSVVHGTAKDLAGQNKADAKSMKAAIEWCQKLVRKKW